MSTTDKPTEYPSLAAALAAFQKALPSVEKNASGQVRGNPGYKYADLADLNRAVLPELGGYGLSFSSKPTLNAAGRFVLAYTLRHDSGESDGGEYPLPEDVSPQDMGSAQTYARRYALQAVTGVAPAGQDDDGAAATRAYSHHSSPRSQPAREEPPAEPTPAELVAQARSRVAAACAENGWDRDVVAALYAEKAGHEITAATDPAIVSKFRDYLYSLPQADLMAAAEATNGAAQ